MIAAISASSPFTSVALIDQEGSILFEGRAEAGHNASGACLALLESGLMEIRGDLVQVALFVADLGPGSFIGARVGVTLVKSLAFANSTVAAGVSAFDLISADQTVCIPSRKGEFFVRVPGEGPARTESIPEGAVGYGLGFAAARYPNAAAVSSLLEKLRPEKPELLMPEYLIEPSISVPKEPYAPQIHGAQKKPTT